MLWVNCPASQLKSPVMVTLLRVLKRLHGSPKFSAPQMRASNPVSEAELKMQAVCGTLICWLTAISNSLHVPVQPPVLELYPVHTLLLLANPWDWKLIMTVTPTYGGRGLATNQTALALLIKAATAEMVVILKSMLLNGGDGIESGREVFWMKLCGEWIEWEWCFWIKLGGSTAPFYILFFLKFLVSFFFENAVAVSQVMVSKTNASDRWLFGEIQVELIRWGFWCKLALVFVWARNPRDRKLET